MENPPCFVIFEPGKSRINGSCSFSFHSKLKKITCMKTTIFPAIKLYWSGISQPAMFDSQIHRMTGFLLQGQEARGTPQRLAVRGDQLDGPHLRRIRGWNRHGKMMKNLWRIIESHEKWNRSWLGLWWLLLHVIVLPWGIWWCHLWVDGDYSPHVE